MVTFDKGGASVVVGLACCGMRSCLGPKSTVITTSVVLMTATAVLLSLRSSTSTGSLVIGPVTRMLLAFSMVPGWLARRQAWASTGLGAARPRRARLTPAHPVPTKI